MISVGAALPSLGEVGCDVVEVQRLIDAATMRLSRDLGTYVGPIRQFTDVHSGGRTGGPGHASIWLANTPLPDSAETPITVETRYSVADDFVALLPGDFFIDGYTLHSPTRFPAGPATVRVSYSAGFPLDAGPAELRALVMELVRYSAAANSSGGKLAESLGDYSYTMGQLDEIVGYHSTVSRWRRYAP